MYTISQVSEMFHLPVSTLRYYDKEGLFPGLERKSGIRKFSDRELDELRMIECLKKSGVEIKDIRQFFAWVSEGPSTYADRKELFEHRKTAVEEEMRSLEKTLAMLKYKCWYYDQLLAGTSEEEVRSLLPDHLPAGIQELYDLAHQ